MNKKKGNTGFTLVELMAVIIILGIIAIIAYPLVTKIIKTSRKKLSKEQINLVEEAARNYAIKYGSKTCKCITVGELQDSGYLESGKVVDPDTGGQLEGYVTIKWLGNQNQYSYTYGEDCSCSGGGSDPTNPPQIVLSIAPGTIDESGWAAAPFEVNVDGENLTRYSYCVSTTGECNPGAYVNNETGKIPVTKDGINYVCAKGINSVGESNVVCESYKLDTGPVFLSSLAYFDRFGKAEDYVSINFKNKPGTLSCDKTINQLTEETNKVNCTATTESGRTVTKEITFIGNVLKPSTYVTSSDTTFLGGTLKRNQVKGIHVVDHKNIPSGASSWDVSLKGNGSVMAWYGAPDSNGLYDVYIGQNGGVIAKNGLSLFSYFNRATTVDISKLDTSKVTNMSYMFYSSQAKSLDLSKLDTSKVTNMSYMFYSSQATSLDLSNFNTSKVTDMNYMFAYSQATSLDLSNFNTSNVTNMAYMFYYNKAKSLDLSRLFNTRKVTNMNGMFRDSQATSLDLSNFNTSNVTSMSQMFYGSPATSLDLSSFDTSNVTNMDYMFYKSSATSLDVSKFNTSKVTNMGYMFYGSQATTLDVSKFNTSKVTDMSYMFAGGKATSLDLNNFNTGQVTNMTAMFYESPVTSLDVSKFDTSKVTNMNYMFQGSKAISLDLSNFNTSKVTTMSQMFYQSQATSLDVSSFDTRQVTTMSYMFGGSPATSLDLSSFDTSNVTNMGSMFSGSKATIGYARTQDDADKFNASSSKPSTLTFVVK